MSAWTRELSRKRRLRQAVVRTLAHLVPTLYMAYMRLVALTSRLDPAGLDRILAERAAGRDLALAVLHQDVFMTPFFLRRLGVQSVASVGDAGGIIATTLGRLGFVMQRGGSSSRASRRRPVLGKMVEYALANRGSGLITAFTVDGSTGPAGVCKAGVAQFAAKTGVPVFCLRAQASRGIHVRSWDRTLIPLPFSRLSFLAAGPFGRPASDGSVDPGLTRRQTEAALHELHARSFAASGKRAVPELVRLEET